ncbi:hypothetical protein [Wolbachia endosymbiont (group A) of Icerya purchasi]|uniref:hypothetical protein n=1 Tax=Wolbachia endosymbiont (group A) of Icerya purchasi TaxID=2954019 RepID=UPI00222F7553|nr:hypothetical protein [Wolbachia endosymbiont (group A) of Icerya purchasi]
MHSGNDKKDSGSSKGWITSSRYEKYNGPNKEIREQYKKEMRERESNKPDTRMDKCSSTGAGGSKDNKK